MIRAVFLALCCLVGFPQFVALAGEANDCVFISIPVEPKSDFSCEHPNQMLGLFLDAPVYFTFIDNQCSHAIHVEIARYLDGGRKYTKLKENASSDLIGCNIPLEPLGWCFQHEVKSGDCPDRLFRKFRSK